MTEQQLLVNNNNVVQLEMPQQFLLAPMLLVNNTNKAGVKHIGG